MNEEQKEIFYKQLEEHVMRQTMNDAEFRTFISNLIFGNFLVNYPMSAAHISERANMIADKILRALRQYQPDFEQYRQIFKEIFDDEVNKMLNHFFQWQPSPTIPRDEIINRIIRTLKDSHKVLRECDVPVDPRIISRRGRIVYPGCDPQVHVVGPMGGFTKADPNSILLESSFCEDTVLKTNYNGVDVSIRIPGLMTAIDYHIEKQKRKLPPYVQLKDLEIQFAPEACINIKRNFKSRMRGSGSTTNWTIGLEPRKD